MIETHCKSGPHQLDHQEVLAKAMNKYFQFGNNLKAVVPLSYQRINFKVMYVYVTRHEKPVLTYVYIKFDLF